MKKKLITALIAFALVFTAMPAVQGEAYAASKTTAPKTITTKTVDERLDQLINKLEGKYFTTDGTSCRGYNHSDYNHSKCNVTNVMAKNSAVRGLVKKYKGAYNVSSYNNLPYHLCSYTDMGCKGDSCFGFASFAEWYLFSDRYTDKVKTKAIYKKIRYNKTNMMKYAKPGDVLRLNGGHSAIVISPGSKGVKVLQSNFSTGGKNCNKVTVNTIYYGNYSYVGICRATNYKPMNYYTLRYSDDRISTKNDSSIIAPQKIDSGVSTPTSTKKFTRAGYNYSKWNICKYGSDGKAIYWCRNKYSNTGNWFRYDKIPSDYTKVELPCGSNIYMAFSAKNTVIYLKPVWKINTYRVSYNPGADAEEVTNMPASQSKTHNKALTLSQQEPTRDGYIFVNWVDSNGITHLPGETYSGNKALTLKATWMKAAATGDEPFYVTEDEYNKYYADRDDRYLATPEYRYSVGTTSTTVNGKASNPGYTLKDVKTVSTSYGNWQASAPKTSDTSGSNYRTVVSKESKSVYTAYAYYCNDKRICWKTTSGSHKSCSNTKNLLRVYSSKSVASGKYKKDSDGSYILGKTIGKAYPGSLGTVYLTTYKGSAVNSFTTAARTGKIYLWKGSNKTIYRTKTTKYQYTWEKTIWSDWSDWTKAKKNCDVNEKEEVRYLITDLDSLYSAV